MNNSQFIWQDSARWRWLWVVVVVLCASCASTPEPEIDSRVQGISQQKLIQIQAIYGPEARQRVEQWRVLVNVNQQQPVFKKLTTVNRFFNQLDFVDDIYHWQQEDYWATPIETLATKGGDCEDFTIAKYYTLGELGIPDHCLRLTYVKALSINKAHMVLTYQCQGNGEVLVLDNLVTDILPAKQRGDLLPVYSFNTSGLWTGGHYPNATPAPGGAGRLSKWRVLLRRIGQGD